MERSPAGKIRRYTERDGLPNGPVRALWEDRDGNIWVGTNAGLARLRSRASGDLEPAKADSDREMVRCLFEDREGNLWVGANSGLNRIRDECLRFTARARGCPATSPTPSSRTTEAASGWDSTKAG